MKPYQVKYIFIVPIVMLGVGNIFAQESINLNTSKLNSWQSGYVRTSYDYNEYRIMDGLTFNYNYYIIAGNKVGYGTGIGLTGYADHAFLPLTLNVLIGFDKKVFFNFYGGYSAGWKRHADMYEGHSLSGGGNGGINIGYMLKSAPDYKCYIKFGYKFQKAKIRNENIFVRDVYYNSLELSLGIMFFNNYP